MVSHASVSSDFNVAQNVLLGGAASVMSFELKGGLRQELIL